jgi:hypothetical protein
MCLVDAYFLRNFALDGEGKWKNGDLLRGFLARHVGRAITKI